MTTRKKEGKADIKITKDIFYVRIHIRNRGTGKYYI